MKQFFYENQSFLLDLVNTEAGRYLLGVKDKNRIVKLSPNAIHQVQGVQGDKVTIKARFYCYERVAEVLFPIIQKMQIVHEQRPIRNVPEAFLHFSDLKRNTKYPQIFLTTTNFVAGAGDGDANRTSFTTWANARANSGGVDYYIQYTDGSRLDALESTQSASNNWQIGRCFFPFNTASLTAAAVISAAVFNLRAALQNNLDSISTVLVEGQQASTSQIVGSDFPLIGSTELGSNRVTLAAFGAGAFKTYGLNASGLALISKISYTKLAVRTSLDFDNSPPTGTYNQADVSFSESANKPSLDVTYTFLASGFLALL